MGVISAIVAGVAAMTGSAMQAKAARDAAKKQAETSERIAKQQADAAKKEAQAAAKRESLIAAQTKEQAKEQEFAELAIGGEATPKKSRLRVGRTSGTSSGAGISTGLSI